MQSATASAVVVEAAGAAAEALRPWKGATQCGAAGGGGCGRSRPMFDGSLRGGVEVRGCVDVSGGVKVRDGVKAGVKGDLGLAPRHRTREHRSRRLLAILVIELRLALRLQAPHCLWRREVPVLCLLLLRLLALRLQG